MTGGAIRTFMIADVRGYTSYTQTYGDEAAGRLPGEVEVTAYFVVAEALTNVAKHARATRARITVTGGPDLLVVAVSDDGVGGADPRGGSGLTGLLDRVEALDGDLRLTSARGVGTTLQVTLPLCRPRAGEDRPGTTTGVAVG